jgi:cysteine desulfuration protein SufE
MNEYINKIQDEIIEEFSKLDDWLEKYEYIIQNGRNLEPLDKKLKTEENNISGCQSQVWLKAKITNEKIQYFADSDSLIVKGMIYLLLKICNNQNPKDIINTDLYFLDKTGLKSNLSPSRANGLMEIIKKIKSYAEKSI